VPTTGHEQMTLQLSIPSCRRVSNHRYHHLHADTPLDPHSPYEGFWWSHMGWFSDGKVCVQFRGKSFSASTPLKKASVQLRGKDTTNGVTVTLVLST